MDDGTFVIVNCDEDTESLIEGDDQSQEGSQVCCCSEFIFVIFRHLFFRMQSKL